MKLAILSGKGGTGKTFLSVNLAVSAGRAAYLDCDVEEPNGRLFLRPEGVTRETVSTPLPAFDPERCGGCRRCVDFCRFNALVYVRGRPMVFPDVCHACGGCALVCPNGAVREQDRPVGELERGRRGELTVVTGILNTGEASAVPVIRAVLDAAPAGDGLTVIDCPPGSSCSVMECVSRADFCILVTEPTAFGFHNFRMVQELTALLAKPCGVVVNKADGPYPPLEEFCAARSLPILDRIPFTPQLATLGASGGLAAEADPALAGRFARLLDRIGGALT